MKDNRIRPISSDKEAVRGRTARLAVLALALLTAAMMMMSCGGSSDSSSGNTSGSSGAGQDNAAAEEAFNSYLQAVADGAADFENGCPVYNTDTGETEIVEEYAIADFDGDGGEELIVHKRWVPGSGALCVYEYEGDHVEESFRSLFNGTLDSTAVFYSNAVMMQTNESDGITTVHMLDDSHDSRFGLSGGRYLVFRKDGTGILQRGDSSGVDVNLSDITEEEWESDMEYLTCDEDGNAYPEVAADFISMSTFTPSASSDASADSGTSDASSADDGYDWTGFPEEPYDSGLYEDDLDRTIAGTWAIPRGYGFIFTLEPGHTGTVKYVDMDMPESEFEDQITWMIRNGYVVVRSDNMRVDMTIFEYDNDNDVMYLYGDEWSDGNAYRRQ